MAVLATSCYCQASRGGSTVLYLYTVFRCSMYFLLVRRRVNGVAIPSDQLRKIQPLQADIHIGDHHSEPLGRVSTQAWVFNSSPGPDIIPRLHDAKLNGMAQLGININGVEEIDGVLYAQSWWCRAVGDYGN